MREKRGFRKHFAEWLRVLLVLAALLWSRELLAQALLGYASGDPLGTKFGETVVSLGDVNEDLVPDFAVASPDANSFSGRVEVFSGGDLLNFDGAPSLLYPAIEGQPFEGFSESLANIGDLNGDGASDFAVGTPRGAALFGAVQIYSGKDGVELLTAPSLQGEADSDQFGFSLASAGDADGDGVSDLIVGAPGYDNGSAFPENFGAAYLISGADGSTICRYVGATSTGGFGASVSGAGDIDGDNLAEVIVGEQLSGGEAVVLSSVGCMRLCRVQLESSFGLVVSGGSGLDVNSDSIPDFAVAGSSTIAVYSGADCSPTAPLPSPIYSIELVASSTSSAPPVISLLGDLSGDGISDLAVGQPNFQFDSSGISSGAATAYSGVDGTELFSIFGDPALNQRLGASLSFFGDLNQDGFSEILVGAPGQGTTSGEVGNVYLVFFEARVVTKDLVPVAVEVEVLDSGNVEFTFEELFSLAPKGSGAAKKKKPKGKVQYRLVITGTEGDSLGVQKKIVTRKTSVVVKNLPAGSYQAKYRAEVAVKKDGKSKITKKTQFSPEVDFSLS